MSTIAAISIALLLYCAVAVPGLFSLYSRRGWLAALFYGGLAAALAAHHVGFDVGRVRPPASAGGNGAVAEGACGQALAASLEAGLILDRSDPTRVVVNASLWQQLPQQVRDVLAGCLGDQAPEGAEVEIVERAPS